MAPAHREQLARAEAWPRLAAAAERAAVALESIARAFEPAQDSLDQGPAQPDVPGVTAADD